MKKMTLKQAKIISIALWMNGKFVTKYPKPGIARLIFSEKINGYLTEQWLQNNAGKLNVYLWQSVNCTFD